MFIGIAMMLAGMQSGRAPAGSRELGISADPHGISMGWFMWPYNFDPAWLITCNGFEASEPKAAANKPALANAV